jgi:RNA polymerase primary sigma factor
MVGTDETIHQLRGISRELARNMVQIPTPEEIAERTELSIEKVRRVIEVARRRKAISLGTAFGEGDSELVDLVTDEDTACPEDEFVQRRVVEQTRRLLATLTPREEEILRKCFGIGETRSHTLKEIGDEFGVTRERVRQIEAVALTKLRKYLWRKNLDFLEI